MQNSSVKSSAIRSVLKSHRHCSIHPPLHIWASPVMADQLSAINNATLSLRQDTEQLRREERKWETAGVNLILSVLEASSISEVNDVAAVCTSLGLDVSDIDYPSQLEAIVDLVDNASKAEFRLAQQRHQLTTRRRQVADATVQLRFAKGLNPQVEKRRADAQEMSGHAHSLAVKAKQYNDESAQLLEQVRDTGLDSECTHDAVSKNAKNLEEMEKRLQQVETELKCFHGLPPVRTF